MKNNKAAFTLIEILVVTVILSIISLAIFSTFSNGLKIYNRITKQSGQEDLVIFCDRLSLDLRNSFNFTGMEFGGREDRFEFATLVNSLKLNKKTVGKAGYEYRAQEKTLSRTQSDFSDVYKGSGSKASAPLKDIKSAKFLYYSYDTQTKEYSWLPEWTKEGLPLAVRLELEFDGQNEQEKFSRTFPINAGNQINEDEGETIQ